ncbi:MAG TPA: guanylate kinase [Candidatus Butyricicoccus avistercoris]|uniref:Guanylate kinase n=1 Tax=Candidatus Butyricicoccus avistercoris TaxID=2838518 RepID=A0A9D1THR7_9FIRM|nr:guanylate kinase [Candidatus Butyricicoccus avistercoris]
MNKNGKLYVFTGPSGTGKGTILSQVLKQDARLFLSVSATTRAPREGEIHGGHYYFLDKQTFEDKINKGEFLEYAQYVGNYYGTLEEPVNEQLKNGNDVILEIEVQGAMQIHEKRPDAVMIFVAPPSIEELERRLVGRGTENPEKVAARMKTAEEELKQADKFDYIIVNDDLDCAIADLLAILRAERCRNSKL